MHGCAVEEGVSVFPALGELIRNLKMRSDDGLVTPSDGDEGVEEFCFYCCVTFTGGGWIFLVNGWGDRVRREILVVLLSTKMEVEEGFDGVGLDGFWWIFCEPHFSPLALFGLWGEQGVQRCEVLLEQAVWFVG